MLNQVYLTSILDYDPDTGVFRWKARTDRDVQWNAKFAGKIAGATSTNGYRQIMVSGKFRRAHHLAWLYVYGTMPRMLDHINRDRCDNRIANLRAATKSQNGANKICCASSGCKGVSWHSHNRKWLVRLKKNRKQIFIGYFDDLKEAARAYELAAQRIHGEFARC